jgi:cell division protein DivIC
MKNGFLKYKYVVVLALVLVWMTFFDDNSFIYRIKLSNEISRLEESIEIHNVKIQELRRQKKELLGNDMNLEKFAREKYLMKKDNEDVFILVDPEEE